MEVIVLSDGKAPKRCFDQVAKQNGYEVVFLPVSEYRNVARKLAKRTAVYLDISSLPESERTRAINSLLKSRHSMLGVIDPKTAIDDVAELIHRGAFDYLGPKLVREGVQPKRLHRMLELVAARKEPVREVRPAKKSEEAPKPSRASYSIAAGGWPGVVAGREYTFCMMFFELDLNEDWRKKAGKAHLDRVTAALEAYMQKTVAPLGGRLWIWESYGGLVLFPFDGKSCDAVLASYRMILNRTIISAEEYDFDTLLSYRIALHIGNTLFRPRGSTGTIISDTVNFIFHLGHQFAEPGGFYLTSAVYPFVPKGLEGSFAETGTFEGVKCYRMKRPVI
ncbi:MAG TPA: hypothetical protein VMV68_01705 [Spirochaetia bacterium]|nr:hypothetical protein [Spirochaetia bacterium]